MAKRGSETVQTVAAVASAAGPLAAQAINTYVLRQPLSGWTLLAVSMPVCIVSYFTCRWAVTEMLRRSTLAKRVMYGRQFIDGTWIEAVTDGNDRLLAVAVMHFDSDVGQVRFSGENFDAGSKSMGTFHSVGTRYDGSKLDFESINEPSGHVGGAVRGIGSYQFTETTAAHVRFVGGFTLMQAGDLLPQQQSLSVEGLRVTDPREVSQLLHADTRCAVLRKYLALMRRAFRLHPAVPAAPVDMSDLQ